MSQEQRCHECGLAFEVDENGIAQHIDEYGDHDWDADAEHTPFSLNEGINHGQNSDNL